MLLALAVVAAAGCARPATHHQPGPAGGSLTRFEAGGTPAALYVPPVEARGVLIYHHGAGEDLDDFVDRQSSESLVGRALDAGWAVAASHAHGDHWGSQASVDANAALWEAVEEVLDVDAVVLLAHSMGGLSSLSCIVAGCVPDVDGWIGVYPLVDQRTMARSSIAAAALPAITAAFGGMPPASLIPIEHVDALADVPMLMWASPQDQVVVMDDNAAELARQVEAAGGAADLRVAHGDHGHPSHFDLEAIVDFLERYSGNSPRRGSSV